MKINPRISEQKKYINRLTESNVDYIFKPIEFLKYKVQLIYCESLCNKDLINNFVLKFFEEKTDNNLKIDNIITFLEENIPAGKIVKVTEYDELMYNLYSGFSIIAVDEYETVLAIETKANLHSAISSSKFENVLKGPNDAFTENYQTNIGLIKKRIKTNKLRYEEHIVGKNTKNKVAVFYVKDMASQEIVDYVNQKISGINIDNVIDSSYIVDTINGNEKNVFPTYLSTERPDLVVSHLFEGKIAILVENSQLITIIPILFVELFHNQEDYYQNSSNANYTRIIRFLAFFITILTPALYLAMITFNHETIPTSLLINFSIQRDGVPLPTILEALLMLITFEILKETDARLPNAIGSSLSIVGALVLGDAAVTAGIVSPIMVIVIAITSISGFILSYLDVTNSCRWWRLLFLLFATVGGIVGVLLGTVIFYLNLSNIKVLGVPYLSPLAPLKVKDITDSVFINKKSSYKKKSVLFVKNNGSNKK